MLILQYFVSTSQVLKVINFDENHSTNGEYKEFVT